MKKIVIRLLPALALLFTQLHINAQVTIGSNISTLPGTILDIKQKLPASDNTTSTYGVLLPRVNISNKENLYPMFKGDANYENNTNAKKDIQDELHIGLTVYNINTDIGKEITPGIYVWTGKKWHSLKVNRSSKKIKSMKTIFTPQHFNVYQQEKKDEKFFIY